MPDQKKFREEGRKDLERLLAHPRSADFQEFRHRLAYVECTGRLPTHTRVDFNRMLVAATAWGRDPGGLDGRAGAARIIDEYRAKFDIDSHPMVVRGKALVAEQWRVSPPAVRRPYGRIRLSRGADTWTLFSNGAILEEAA